MSCTPTTWTCNGSSSACESCRADVLQMGADIYGLPGNKETSPGLVGEVAELRRSRNMMLLALRAPGCC